MILMFDLAIGLALGVYLFNKKLINSYISIILTIFVFIIIKAVLLGIVLGYFKVFFIQNIANFSMVINCFLSLFLLLNIKSLSFKNITIKPKINAVFIVSFMFIIITSILIYNVIPYGGDELMYHLPITLELLNKGSWMSDLGLSYYWHNDIRQWYPKNLYFSIDYFLAIFGKNIISFQIYSIFTFIFFFLSVYNINKYFFEKNSVNTKNIALLSTLIGITTPVIYLHLFVKVDILMFALLLLFIYNLLIFSNIYFLIILGFLIIGFKIIGVYFLAIITIAYFLYLLFFEREKLKDIFSNIYKNKYKIIVFFALSSVFFLYSFIYNKIINGNFLYPINIIKLDNSGLQENMSIFYGIKYYLRDYIFSDYYNYFLKSGILTYEDSGLYNYDRGLGIMGFFMIIGTCLYFIFKKEDSSKINNFIFLIIFVFLLLSYSKLNIIFGHRYQIFIYILLIFIFSFSIYTIFKKDYKYIMFLVFLLNISLLVPFIGGFGEKGSGVNQLYNKTSSDFCDKIMHIGDISRDDYRSGWKYICQNIENKNILSINQVFNFYLYGKNFDNKIYNKLFFNKDEFLIFLKNYDINYIITSNKNNLYSNFGIDKNKFFANSTDYNDESTMFCKNIDYKDIVGVDLKYSLEGTNDVIFNFGINDFEKNIILKGDKTSLKFNEIDIKNLCLTIFDTPKKSLNNKTKYVKFDNIELKKSDGNKIKIDISGFSFRDYAIEDVWLFKNGYKKIYVTESNEIDYFYLWSK